MSIHISSETSGTCNSALQGALAASAACPVEVIDSAQGSLGLAPVESLAVVHSTTPEIAAEVAGDLSDLLPDGAEPCITRFGPALGVHTGPGAIGIALLQAGR